MNRAKSSRSKSGPQPGLPANRARDSEIIVVGFDFGGHFRQRDTPELVSAAIRDMLGRIRGAAAS